MKPGDNVLTLEPVKKEFLAAVEESCFKGLRHIDAFLAYEGTDPRYYQKAKVVANAIQGYGKLRQGETARIALVLGSRKQQAALPPGAE